MCRECGFVDETAEDHMESCEGILAAGLGKEWRCRSCGCTVTAKSGRLRERFLAHLDTRHSARPRLPR